jgi:hypothetical protein
MPGVFLGGRRRHSRRSRPADRSVRIVRGVLCADSTVGTGAHLARPIALVGNRRTRIRGCRHRYQRCQKGNGKNGFGKHRRHCLLLCHLKSAPCALLQTSSQTFVGRLLNHGEVKTKNRGDAKTAVDAASRLLVAASANEGGQRLQAAMDADLHVRFRHPVARGGFGDALALELDSLDRLTCLPR